MTSISLPLLWFFRNIFAEFAIVTNLVIRNKSCKEKINLQKKFATAFTVALYIFLCVARTNYVRFVAVTNKLLFCNRILRRKVLVDKTQFLQKRGIFAKLTAIMHKTYW